MGPRARRRRSGTLRSLGLTTVVILALILGLQLIGRLGSGPETPEMLAGGAATSAVTPRAARPTPTAYPPPTVGAPSATPRPKPKAGSPDRSLKRNSLYGVDLYGTRVSCGITVRRAKPPLRNAELGPYLRSVLKCLVKVHRKPLAAQGFTVTEPKIAFLSTPRAE